MRLEADRRRSLAGPARGTTATGQVACSTTEIETDPEQHPGDPAGLVGADHDEVHPLADADQRLLGQAARHLGVHVDLGVLLREAGHRLGEQHPLGLQVDGGSATTVAAPIAACTSQKQCSTVSGRSRSEAWR